MSDEKFQALFKAGTQLLHRGKAADAVPILEEAYALYPDNFDVAINLGGAYILTKKFKKAVPILEVLSDQDPNNVMVWTNLGAAYLGNPVLAKDQHQLKAIAAFEKALEINPIAPHVAYNIGLIYRDRKEFDNAIYWFRQAVKANPSDRDARSHLAKLEAQFDAGS